MTSITRFAFLSAVIMSASLAIGQAPNPDPGRFANDIASFGEWDSKNGFPEDAILFVGSSSIRMWPTAEAFPGYQVINRGFGGSEMSDVVHYYEQVIQPYEPAMIVLYAGDNDIAGGKSPEQVFSDFRKLYQRLRAEMPETSLVYISIKPSVQRWEHWSTMMQANSLIRNFADEQPKVTYADLASPLLDKSGNPRDVYVEDGLHLNEYGYQLWRDALAPILSN